MLILTNFLVIALALFLALVVAASAANLHGLARGDALPAPEYRGKAQTQSEQQTLTADMPADTQTVQTAQAEIAVAQPVGETKPRVRVLGQPLKPEQEPRLVGDTRKRA